MTFAICDDELTAAEGIAGAVSDCLRELGCDTRGEVFSHGRALIESRAAFDLIFLDIRLKDEDGMEVAKELRRRRGGSLIVFVTALEECVFEAFEVEAFDYLVKPVEPERLRRTVERAVRAIERRGSGTVAVQRGGGCEVVPLSEIVYCEVQGRKLYIHRGDGCVVDCYGRLEEFAGRLDGRFFRCHRSYLLNLDCVRGCGGGQAVLSGGETVPVSRLRERALTEALLRRMGGRRG